MQISQAFPTKYVSAGDLNGKEPTMTMDRVSMENIEEGKDPKPVLFFRGAQKGMVLNKTNANNIAAMYGDDTDRWPGQQITLFTQWVDFQGRSVQAIRVRPAAPAPAMPQQTNTQAAPDQFQQDLKAAQGGAGVGVGPTEDLDDEIPF